MKKAASIFNSLTILESVSDAWIFSDFNDGLKMLVKKSQRDLANKKHISTLSSYSINSSREAYALSIPFPIEFSGVRYMSYSPSGKYNFIVRVDDKELQHLEIWNTKRLLSKLNVTEMHGLVYNDRWFEGVSWSKNEKQIFYIAEQKKEKKLSHFDIKKENELLNKGNEFEYNEDWGEKYVNFSNPRIFNLSLVDGDDRMELNVKEVEGIPPTLSCGQVTISPLNDKEIVFTGWSVEPRRLGTIYCYNRSCGIYSLSLLCNEEGKSLHTPTLLSTDDYTARCPRFSNDGNKLAFLFSNEKGTHSSCFGLKIMSWIDKNVDIITDIVYKTADNTSFPGLFVSSLPKRCWTDDGSIILSSLWRSSLAILKINCSTKEVSRFDKQYTGSWDVLDVFGGIIVASHSSVNKPSSLQVFSLKANSFLPEIVDKDDSSLDLPKKVSDILNSIEYRVLDITPKDDKETNYQAILIHPSVSSLEERKRFPLVVFPHGGPHSCFDGAFSLSISTLVACGYVVALVNYRGSTGFGQSNLLSLPGKIGRQDVDDTHNVALTLLQMDLPFDLDKERVAITGGSHGGFLTCHLIGQFPNFYKAAATRNPVCNISSMISVSDIPDWCYVEAGLTPSYDFSTFQPPTSDSLTKMYDCSPVKHLNKVITPTLLMIGAKDRRVPPSQGIEFYHCLKAKGVKVKMLLYPDDVHALDGIAAESDASIHMIHWFDTHLNV